MTPDPALDAAIRQARHLLFAFDGTVRQMNAGKSANSTSTTVPHVHDALAACRESGRSASVISANSSADVHAYLDGQDLSAQVTGVVPSIGAAATALNVSPADCMLITSSSADIEAAQAAGTPSIGYAGTPDEAAHMVDIGATSCIYSMADLALTLRARPA